MKIVCWTINLLRSHLWSKETSEIDFVKKMYTPKQ